MALAGEYDMREKRVSRVEPVPSGAHGVRTKSAGNEKKGFKSQSQASEALYRLLFENSADAILLTQPDGKISAANPAACRMFGRSEEEIIKLRRAELVDSKDTRIPSAIEERRRTGQFKGEFNCVKKDGSVFPCDVSTRAFKDSSGNERTSMIIRDLTERKLAEEALRESEEELRVLFEQLPIGVTLLDQNRKITYANPALEKILDISRDDLLKGKYQNRRYLRPDGTSMPPEEYASVRAFQKQQPVHDVETGVITESGKTIWISVSATPFPVVGKGVVIATVDITERKRAEESLRRSEHRFRSIFDNMAEGVALHELVFDKAGKPINYRIISCNPKYGLILGISPQKVLGTLATDAYNVPEPPYLSNYSKVALSGVASRFTAYFAPMNKYFDISVVPWGKMGFATIFTDITERRQAEATLRKSESHLRAMAIELSSAEERERQRLAIFLHDEIGQTLALLRIKFGGLAGAWMSKSGKQSIRQIRDLLEKAIDQAHTLTFELSPPILHQLGLEAAVEWAGEKISQDHGINFTLNDDGVNKPLDADIKTLLFTCVRELMFNTVKHAKAKRLSAQIAREGEKILITIIDDGIGFEPSLLENHPAQVGFGLFSVRERLVAVGGTFELGSEPGRGTRVTLSAPLKKEIPSSSVS